MIQEHADLPSAPRTQNGDQQKRDAEDFSRPPDRMTWLSLASPHVRLEITAVFAEALSEAAKLPVEDQNYLAFRIMEEIAEEKKWTESFERSPEVLETLVAQANQEIADGKIYPLEDLL